MVRLVKWNKGKPDLYLETDVKLVDYTLQGSTTSRFQSETLSTEGACILLVRYRRDVYSTRMYISIPIKVYQHLYKILQTQAQDIYLTVPTWEELYYTREKIPAKEQVRRLVSSLNKCQKEPAK